MQLRFCYSVEPSCSLNKRLCHCLHKTSVIISQRKKNIYLKHKETINLFIKCSKRNLWEHRIICRWG